MPSIIMRLFLICSDIFSPLFAVPAIACSGNTLIHLLSVADKPSMPVSFVLFMWSGSFFKIFSVNSAAAGPG